MVLVIDPQIAGISGDMLLCSLVDLGADRNKIIDGIRQSEKFFPGSAIDKIDFQKIQKRGIQAVGLVLKVKDDAHQRKGLEIKKAIADSASAAGLSERAQAFAKSCIETLISSESSIHGIPEESVHFHEAAGIDTLVDIVGAAIALEDLGLFDERIVCLPVSVGGGSVSFSHGTMSNPAGAILEIFKNTNLTIRGSGIGGELTTPTGACILANLAGSTAEYYPPMRVDSVGYGAGEKDFEGFANVLKIVRGSENGLTSDTVRILETNVDDVSGEILGNLIEKIMDRGAKDVSIFHGITKKGRPTNLVCVICDDQNVEELVDTLVLETGTLGVRISESARFTVPRTAHSALLTLAGRSFKVNYKKSSFKGRADFKIEFDDLQDISGTVGMSVRETESLLRKEIEKLEDS